MSRKLPPSDSDNSYEVGYGKPPKHAQFKPGHSGNLKGRPRAPRNLKTVLDEVLKEKIPIREGERTRMVPRLDALVRLTTNNALKSDLKAVALIIQLARAAGLLDEEPVSESLADEPLADDRQAILDAYVARRTNTKASSAPSPVLAPPELLDDTPDEADEK